MTWLENLTTTEVEILVPGEDSIVLDRPTRPPASVRFADRPEYEVLVMGANVPIVRRIVRDVVNLPDPEPGTLYVVSGLVADYVQDRDDLVVPHRPLRDRMGKVFACQALAIHDRGLHPTNGGNK